MDEHRRGIAAGRLRALGLLLAAALLCPMPAVVEAGDSEEGELACLAQTLYWEAKTEGRDGMLAVAWVILNRMRDGEYPRSVCGVVKQGREKPGCQFSYWCDGKPDTPKPDEAWALAQAVAKEMLSSPPPDPTGGAVFYHAAGTRAPWSTSRVRTARIGRHVYYR
jgi:spore germination cell wall hydrolase CwlJ-like protein